MRKTSKTARITILLLVLCLISTAMLSGTFARYTSEYAGADTALIAKWDISVSDGDEHGFTMLPGEAQQLDLFKHEYDTNILSTAGDSKIIAPGVDGDFTLKVENKGDVAAEMTFDFDVSGDASNAPIEYKLKEGQTWGDLDALKTALDELEKMKNVAAGTGTAEQTVEWRWPLDGSDVYGTNDEVDTDLGTDSVTDNRSTYILTITATAKQIQPTK
jgi:hypothetical protein